VVLVTSFPLKDIKRKREEGKRERHEKNIKKKRKKR
jgi:hypothetical protein